MWNNFVSNARVLAEKAKAAAESIEGQLNESVGAPPTSSTSSSSKLTSGVDGGNTRKGFTDPYTSTSHNDYDEDDDDDDDAFYNDDDEIDFDMHDNLIAKKESSNIIHNQSSGENGNVENGWTEDDDHISYSDGDDGFSYDREDYVKQQQQQEEVVNQQVHDDNSISGMYDDNDDSQPSVSDDDELHDIPTSLDIVHDNEMVAQIPTTDDDDVNISYVCDNDDDVNISYVCDNDDGSDDKLTIHENCETTNNQIIMLSDDNEPHEEELKDDRAEVKTEDVDNSFNITKLQNDSEVMGGDNVNVLLEQNSSTGTEKEEEGDIINNECDEISETKDEYKDFTNTIADELKDFDAPQQQDVELAENQIDDNSPRQDGFRNDDIDETVIIVQESPTQTGINAQNIQVDDSLEKHQDFSHDVDVDIDESNLLNNPHEPIFEGKASDEDEESDLIGAIETLTNADVDTLKQDDSNLCLHDTTPDGEESSSKSEDMTHIVSNEEDEKIEDILVKVDDTNDHDDVSEANNVDADEQLANTDLGTMKSEELSDHLSYTDINKVEDKATLEHDSTHDNSPQDSSNIDTDENLPSTQTNHDLDHPFNQSTMNEEESPSQLNDTMDDINGKDAIFEDGNNIDSEENLTLTDLDSPTIADPSVHLNDTPIVVEEISSKSDQMSPFVHKEEDGDLQVELSNESNESSKDEVEQPQDTLKETSDGANVNVNIDVQNNDEQISVRDESNIDVTPNNKSTSSTMEEVMIRTSEAIMNSNEEQSIYVPEQHSDSKGASNDNFNVNESNSTPVSNLASQTSDDILRLQEEHDLAKALLESQISSLESALSLKESELTSKSDEIKNLIEKHEFEKEALKSKVRETKEEAKKRIGKAKERVEDMQARLQEAHARADQHLSEGNQSEEIIKALRQEGEDLARKQNEMENLVRETRSEMRELKGDLEAEREAKDKANSKINDLTAELSKLKNELKSAKIKENQVDKLDSDLLVAKEEREKNATIIISLEAQLKELKEKNSALSKEMEAKIKEKVSEGEHNLIQVRLEKDTLLQDLEGKMRTSEREANLREDALRHEVSELRKRWQDAIRRADALNMDLQESTAPLMRQLESTERQNRARATAWADLENKLRSDIENHMNENKELKQQNDHLSTENKRLNELLDEKSSMVQKYEEKIDELNSSYNNVSSQYSSSVQELEAMKDEYKEMFATLKSEEASSRNSLLLSHQKSEKQYQDRINALETELDIERNKRSAHEGNVRELLDHASTILDESKSTDNFDNNHRNGEKDIRLSAKSNQVDILNDLLNIDEDEEDKYEMPLSSSDGGGSFAFMEQLSQALKSLKIERDILRKQLDESESTREKLSSDLSITQDATERLKEFEAQVIELNAQVLEKDLEILALKDDIKDVREMFRFQVNALMNGGVDSVGMMSPSSKSTTPSVVSTSVSSAVQLSSVDDQDPNESLDERELAASLGIL